MDNYSPTTQRLIDHANQLHATMGDVTVNYAANPTGPNTPAYVKMLDVQRAHEWARWRAMIAMGEEGGLR